MVCTNFKSIKQIGSMDNASFSYNFLINGQKRASVFFNIISPLNGQYYPIFIQFLL